MEEQAHHQPKPRVRKSGCGCGGGRKRQVLTEPKEATRAVSTEMTAVTEIQEVSAVVANEESDIIIQPAEAVSDQTTEASRQAPMQTVTQFLAQITKSRPRTKRKHK